MYNKLRVVSVFFGYLVARKFVHRLPTLLAAVVGNLDVGNLDIENPEITFSVTRQELLGVAKMMSLVRLGNTERYWNSKSQQHWNLHIKSEVFTKKKYLCFINPIQEQTDRPKAHKFRFPFDKFTRNLKYFAIRREIISG